MTNYEQQYSDAGTTPQRVEALTAQKDYNKGFNAGLEAAASHCDHCAELALSVIECNLFSEAVMYRERAKDIRGLKK